MTLIIIIIITIITIGNVPINIDPITTTLTVNLLDPKVTALITTGNNAHMSKFNTSLCLPRTLSLCLLIN